MNICFKIMVAALALCAAGAPAQDEPPLGSRLGSRYRPGLVLAPAQSARAAQDMASCMVFHHPSEVRDYLLSLNPKTSMRAFTQDEVSCLDLFDGTPANGMTDTRQVSFPPDVLRGMLSEALLRQSMPQVAALVPVARQLAYVRPWFAVTSRNIVVDEMVACVVDVDPAGVASLIRSAPYSPAEATAFGIVGAQFGPCLRANAKLQANRQALRAALAEALFQRLSAWIPAKNVPTATGSK